MNKNEIQNLIKELLEKATLPVKEISITEKESTTPGQGTTWFSCRGEPAPLILFGRGGEALFALNHLVKKIVEAKTIIKKRRRYYVPIKILILRF